MHDGGWLSDKERKRLTRIPSDTAMTATLAGTGLIVSSMQTLVTPIVPQLPALLDTSVAEAQWVLTATLLAACIGTPIAGRLGDMYGKRRITLALLVLMVLGSLIAAISNTLIPLVIGRALQGLSLGAIALGISILRDVIHPSKLGRSVALVSASLGVGGAVGLAAAALIAENFDWHYLFWLSAALGVLAFVLVIRIIPVSTLRTAGRFDWVGSIGLSIGLVALLLAISNGSVWGWTSPLTLTLLIGSVVVFALWGWYEVRVVDPLVDLRVAARKPVLLTNLASVAAGFAFFVTAGSQPILLELPSATGVGLGQTILVAALCLMPNGIVMFLLSPVAARLSDRRGPRTSLVLGMLIIAIAFAISVFLMQEIWHVILVSTLVGAGVSFAYSAMPTLIMHAVPATETAAANGLNSVMRTLGSTVAASLIGVILSSSFTVYQGIEIPTRGAFQTVFAVGAGVAFLGALLALIIPRRVRVYETASIPIQLPEDSPHLSSIRAYTDAMDRDLIEPNPDDEREVELDEEEQLDAPPTLDPDERVEQENDEEALPDEERPV
ncbi:MULTISPECIES: MFS transporter [unclassified Cryobacterium]|uniref:MFS transporter n=1 Tax=unclassified Cryobacterium TaxID=2649013 RepID=UPI001446496E|nr:MULTISPECIES: MFS transporter [unclassified Cryobacterium]